MFLTLNSGSNIFDRHNILVNSIGAFPEEIEAHGQIKWMIGLSYTLLVVVTIIQIVSYYLYNGRFHPFASIILPKQVNSQAGPQVLDDMEHDETEA